ncbi:hypothetical protein DICPUDRAFT_78157 [Dictyostelium purpureum]|uniref:Uncharacterized protein n=1 Tax=Dictyostelium purpureum TaxID=5786 RepID=F0ZIQ5_DICPU|nr:uncharacterized protein DICPUDRAFT_78157 [Dictyostelium purpureum]EGC36163.1 hypothetical protein DICPUDRAFT_78157 [Dictyostelium purpureum]|eukprot:XP_003287296.1 hypothetical protein DICPUDRAFT_78157 [Dictyostelium purpureum]
MNINDFSLLKLMNFNVLGKCFKLISGSLLRMKLMVQSKSNNILKDYVYSKDPNYKWTLNTTYDVGFANIQVIELVSQQWMKDYTNSSIWKHWVSVCIPKAPTQTKMGLLYVTGGAYNSKEWVVPSQESLEADFGQQVCKESNAITVTVNQVPNQYITFDDGVARDEDYIVAYSWRKYIDTQVSTWVSLLPQTKSVIKAMDAVQEYGNENGVIIESFVVFGASKRGWTTYGVAMVGDERVAAIVPMVIGVLNLVDDIKVQMQTYGNWSFALDPYAINGIPSFVDTEYFNVVTDIVDPLNYIDIMEKIPKYIILTIEDEFFLPDSTKFFYDQIKGEKRLGLFQTDHSVTQFAGVSTEISKYFNIIVNKVESPELSWKITYSKDNSLGTIEMTVVKGTPTRVVVYSVNTISKTHRDFRKFTCSDYANCYQAFTYSAQNITLESDNTYSVSIKGPDGGGWTAFYFEVEFGDVANVNTELAIVPNTFPFPECSSEICASGVPEWVINSANSVTKTNLLVLSLTILIYFILI